MNKKILVFVYGTLKKGFHNHYLLAGSQYLGNAKTEPIYQMYSAGGFPIVSREGDKEIIGEVYSVSEACKKALDRLEGFTGEQGNPDNWYDVDVINTEYGEAFMYCQNKEQINNLKQINAFN